MKIREIRLQPKQEAFLVNPADIVIGGGAAGGGKSFALVFQPLKHDKIDGFNAVIFRRTYPEITRPGGLWDEASMLYPYAGGVPHLHAGKFVFPHMTVTFGHMLNDQFLNNWKSSQIALIEFDQLETFTEKQFFYMLSRNRSKVKTRSYIRATANPEPGWLAKFIDWWIAPDGYADMDRAGKTRAFVRPGDDIIWADTKEELQDRYPAITPKTVTYFPFTIYDNPILLENDPSYLSNLQAMTYVDRERLLGDPVRGGNWKIMPAAGKVFRREWFEIVDSIPDGGIACRFFDYAGTAKGAFAQDPDFTSGTLMIFTQGNYYIADLYHKQIAAAITDKETDKIYFTDFETQTRLGRRYIARWENEPGSASLRDSAARTGRLAGIDAKGTGVRSTKLIAWKPLAAMAETGKVKVLKAVWNDVLLNELHGVPELPHDDIADSSGGAFTALAKEVRTAKVKSYQG